MSGTKRGVVVMSLSSPFEMVRAAQASPDSVGFGLLVRRTIN